MYPRPPGRGDFNAAREFELVVGEWLGEYKVANLDSPDRLDFWVPGIFLDVKEKRQRLGSRWHRLGDVPEHDLFIIDELSVRKAAQHWPSAYFLLRDIPGGDRIFLAGIWEMMVASRARVDRETSPGRRKGKWIVHLPEFRQLSDPANQLLPMLLADQVAMPWKRSECLSQLEVATV